MNILLNSYIIKRRHLFLTCNVAFKFGLEPVNTEKHNGVIDSRWIRVQSETTALIGWFHSGHQNSYRVRKNLVS